MLSAHETIAKWAVLDGCAAAPKVTRDGKIESREYRQCRANTRVTAYILEGGTHSWPSGASETIWNFFTPDRSPAQLRCPIALKCGFYVSTQHSSSPSRDSLRRGSYRELVIAQPNPSDGTFRKTYLNLKQEDDRITGASTTTPSRASRRRMASS